MRNETHILDELNAAKQEYGRLAADGNATQAQVQEAADKAKALANELDAFVATGAEPCENCGNAPMGMLKTPAHTHNGIDLPNTWEVGCVYCDPVLVERNDGKDLVIEGEVKKVKRRSYSARGFSPAEAVAKWNNGEWVEDFYFDRVRGFTPEYPKGE